MCASYYSMHDICICVSVGARKCTYTSTQHCYTVGCQLLFWFLSGWTHHSIRRDSVCTPFRFFLICVECVQKVFFFCTHVFYVHSSVWMFLIWQMTNNRRIILFFIHYFDLTNYFSFVVIVFNLKFRKNK